MQAEEQSRGGTDPLGVSSAPVSATLYPLRSTGQTDGVGLEEWGLLREGVRVFAVFYATRWGGGEWFTPMADGATARTHHSTPKITQRYTYTGERVPARPCRMRSPDGRGYGAWRRCTLFFLRWMEWCACLPPIISARTCTYVAGPPLCGGDTGVVLPGKALPFSGTRARKGAGCPGLPETCE